MSNIIYPIVLEKNKTANKLILKIEIPSDLVYFNGHFPNQPIVAGVVQINWVIYFAQKYWAFTQPISKIKSIKFQQFITPNLILLLEINQHKKGLSFCYQNKTSCFSKGDLSV